MLYSGGRHNTTEAREEFLAVRLGTRAPAQQSGPGPLYLRRCPSRARARKKSTPEVSAAAYRGSAAGEVDEGRPSLAQLRADQGRHRSWRASAVRHTVLHLS